MIAAFQKEEGFLADLARPLAADALRIWWLGQSGFLVRSGTHSLLLDPYLSDSLTQKYAATDKPHVRMTERVIAPEAIAREVDVVTSSHNHTDHLDAETLRPMLEANPALEFVIPEANRQFISNRLGIPASRPIGLPDSGSAQVAGFEFHGIPAAHNELDRDAQGHPLFMGYVIRCGLWTLYHSGDTLLYPGLAERLRALGPIHVALLPINGNKPERRVAGNLDGTEAARLANEIAAGCVVPCHYEMFEFNTADPAEQFIPECERLQQRYHVLRAGEALTLDPRFSEGTSRSPLRASPVT